MPSLLWGQFPCAYRNKPVRAPHARTESPTWCLPAPSSDQLWCIMRGTWLSEKPADLPCLDELQHFQAHTGHWLEGLNSQPAVYQRSGTGNQFSNAVWAYSLQLWSTPHCADTHICTPTRTDVCGCSPVRNQGHTKYNPDGRRKSRGQLPNINLPSVAVIGHCHLMALSKWVQLSWGRL